MSEQNPYQSTPPTPMSPADEKLWATLIHVGGILFSFLPALIGYLVLRDRGPFIRAHTATALNFQISFYIYAAVLVPISIVTLGIGSVLYAPLFIIALVFMIMAALAANRGEGYSYPLTIRFVS
ncbi:MAG: DUF4870 domain-containing protein [Cryobacterium sp.]|uniref:DUF4870 domain-containing protein n=1 Tax=unclassified Cryobacterium TaxID=2649013 RepID=UPI001A1B19AB|nr:MULTISPECIES: DUF4870 domain-containing protein [unclassified Cryobacterium]MCY7404582.1 DUF4870 domain-containing protein [Cryobacterium sp.]MEC5153887.1 putative Tic20 family protein [Cryobacterium sp. CAN_C3]